MAKKPDDTAIVAVIRAICDALESYPYRRFGAELRPLRGFADSRKVRRLMREPDLQPKRKQPLVTTMARNQNGPVLPEIAKDFEVHCHDQVWAGDIIHVTITTGILYLSVILNA